MLILNAIYDNPNAHYHQITFCLMIMMALYHFPVIFKIRLTPIDANLRQQMRKSVKSASKIITGITGFWNSA